MGTKTFEKPPVLPETFLVPFEKSKTVHTGNLTASAVSLLMVTSV